MRAAIFLDTIGMTHSDSSACCLSPRTSQKKADRLGMRKHKGSFLYRQRARLTGVIMVDSDQADAASRESGLVVDVISSTKGTPGARDNSSAGLDRYPRIGLHRYVEREGNEIQPLDSSQEPPTTRLGSDGQPENSRHLDRSACIESSRKPFRNVWWVNWCTMRL